MPNQTIYYNNTYTSPSLEGLEVQAQFKDLDSGYIWNQDINSEELEIKTFDTSGPKSGERIVNGSIQRLCAVMWRGAQTFFEYSVLIGAPVDSDNSHSNPRQIVFLYYMLGKWMKVKEVYS